MELCIFVCVGGGGGVVVRWWQTGQRGVGGGRKEWWPRTKRGRERVKRDGERRSESKRRTACRGYCDGNVIRKPDCGAKGQSRLPHLPPI